MRIAVLLTTLALVAGCAGIGERERGLDAARLERLETAVKSDIDWSASG